MDKKIKSHFIVNKIFNLINFVKKLNLIVHNKKIQNILNVGILDYRRISSKFIIGAINGIGKEYKYVDNGDVQLLYEGELLKGKRNGIGKE